MRWRVSINHKEFLIIALGVFFIFGFDSCTRKETNKNNLIATNTFLNENNKEIESIIELSDDTIIASLMYQRGIIITKNRGKSWTHLAKGLPIRDITYTDKGLLVGMLTGIRNTNLFISKDFGLNWIIVNYKGFGFVPDKFVSKPHEKLKIECYDNEKSSYNNLTYHIYELTGSDFQKDWKLIETIKKKEDDSYKEDELNNPYRVDRSRDILFKIEGKDTTQLLELSHIDNFQNTYFENDIVHIAGEDLTELIPDKQNPDKLWDSKAYYVQYNRIWGRREFRIPGTYCYLRKSNFGNVFVTSQEGIFKEEKGKLIQLY